MDAVRVQYMEQEEYAETKMTNIRQISRRNLLKVAGAGVVGLATAACQPIEMIDATKMAGAGMTTTMPEVFAIHRTQLGDIEITIIYDGFINLEAPLLGVNAPDGAINNLLSTYNIPAGLLPTGVQVVVVKSGDELTLIDTGLGDFDGLDANAGRLISTLNFLGMAPNTIDNVIITHMHPDHIAGASQNGSVAFPNAQYYLPQPEWDFLQGEPTGTALDPFIQLANAKLEPVTVNDQLAFYSNEDEIVSGIQAVAAPGHTPGHHALLIANGSRQLFCLTDTVQHNIVSFEHPEWVFAFDSIPEAAVETRRRLLNRAADEQMQIFTVHLPFPGIGYVSKSDNAFRYVAAV